MSAAPTMARNGTGTDGVWHVAGAVLARAVLGGLLIYAAVHKIGHAADLARIIHGYRILHPELVNLAAMALPPLELIVGAMLLAGLLRRSAALVACGLFGAFTMATGLAMVRGIDAICGCFSLGYGSERIGWAVLVRDSALTLAAGYLVAHPSRFAELDALLDESPKLDETPHLLSEGFLDPEYVPADSGAASSAVPSHAD